MPAGTKEEERQRHDLRTLPSSRVGTRSSTWFLRPSLGLVGRSLSNKHDSAQPRVWAPSTPLPTPQDTSLPMSPLPPTSFLEFHGGISLEGKITTNCWPPGAGHVSLKPSQLQTLLRTGRTTKGGPTAEQPRSCRRDGVPPTHPDQDSR